MPILNLSKTKTQEKKDEVKEDVPDELPSLPGEEETKPEEKKADFSAGEEKPSMIGEEKKQSPAPDELPPIQDGEPEKEESAPVEEEPEPIVKHEIKHKILDERLYFSKLIKKLNEGASMDDIEKEVMSKDVMNILKENVDDNKKDENKIEAEKDIKAKIANLQKLEKEWSALKLELDEKKERFRELEHKIKEGAADIKKRFVERAELGKKV